MLCARFSSFLVGWPTPSMKDVMARKNGAKKKKAESIAPFFF
jgi:hypothetical protein